MWRWRIGHESLSILFRFAHNPLSVLDPASLVYDIAVAFNSRRNSAQALLLHLHLKHKTTLEGGCVLVEMAGIEPASESECNCESTVRRRFFDLSS